MNANKVIKRNAKLMKLFIGKINSWKVKGLLFSVNQIHVSVHLNSNISTFNVFYGMHMAKHKSITKTGDSELLFNGFAS